MWAPKALFSCGKLLKRFPANNTNPPKTSNKSRNPKAKYLKSLKNPKNPKNHNNLELDFDIDIISFTYPIYLSWSKVQPIFMPHIKASNPLWRTSSPLKASFPTRVATKIDPSFRKSSRIWIRCIQKMTCKIRSSNSIWIICLRSKSSQ